MRIVRQDNAHMIMPSEVKAAWDEKRRVFLSGAGASVLHEVCPGCGGPLHVVFTPGKRTGYSPHECLELFVVLEQYAMDMENSDAIYGPDLSDSDRSKLASWKAKAELWAWEHAHGYLPLHDRRKLLLKHLQETTKHQEKR